MPVDPFAVKQFPKWHPRRLAHKSASVIQEWQARRGFDRYALPERTFDGLPPAPEVDWSNTSVTPDQMRHLLRALALAEALPPGPIVEVGCFRGETTRSLALATSRQLVAVDPYQGYGGAESDYERFQTNTKGLGNVSHDRMTSGEAARGWSRDPACFIFIDAVHDYANTSFDIEVWSKILGTGGVLALHDTDSYCFAGTRKAAFEALGPFTLLAHLENLTILVKSPGPGREAYRPLPDSPN